MSWLVVLALVALLALPLARSISRSNELFVVAFRGGRARLVRGRLPQRLLDDLDDVARSAPAAALRVIVTQEDGLARTRVEGPASPATAQQVRNVVGQYRVAQLRAGAPRRP
ncbi:MAG: DUF3634 family protein [Polyangiaceae bacterium]|nr:DUF3634 family protein [Polyangiaceae bacterium]